MNISFDLDDLNVEFVNSLYSYLELQSKLDLHHSKVIQFQEELAALKRNLLLSNGEKNESEDENSFEKINSTAYLTVWVANEKNKKALSNLKNILSMIENRVSTATLVSIIKSNFKSSIPIVSLNYEEMYSDLKLIRSIVFDQEASGRGPNFFIEFFFKNIKDIYNLVSILSSTKGY